MVWEFAVLLFLLGFVLTRGRSNPLPGLPDLLAVLWAAGLLVTGVVRVVP
jgi:hypothetical protein